MSKEFKQKETYESPELKAYRVIPSNHLLQSSIPSSSSFGAEDAGDYSL